VKREINWGLPPIPENIPSELKSLPRWVGFIAKKKDNGKYEKIPVNVLTNNYASTKKPGNWATFNQALQHYRAGQTNGIGFVLTNLEDYFFVDLDSCRDDQTGEIAPWANEVILKLNSYTEISPSGTGFRIIGKGALPNNDFNNHQRGIEMYGGMSSRNFTMTGHLIEDCPSNINSVDDEIIENIYSQYKATDSQATTDLSIDRPRELPNDLPDIPSLELPAHMEIFLIGADASEYGDDRSAALLGVTKHLYNQGYRDEEVLGLLAKSPGAMETASARRSGTDACLDWIWTYTCIKARLDAPPPILNAAPLIAPIHPPVKLNANQGMFLLTGILKEVHDYISAKSLYPQPVYTLAASLSTCALLIGNKYRTDDDMYGNLYLISIGESGSGKESPQKSAKEIALECSLHMQLADGIGSGPGLEDFLKAKGDNPSVLLILDEIGKLLQQLSRPNGDDHGIMRILLKLFTATGGFYTTRLLANKDHSVIQNPYVNLLGSTTAGALESSLSSDDTEAGWIGRLLFFPSSDHRPSKQDPSNNQVALAKIKSFSGVVDSIPSPVIVPYDEDAKLLIDQHTVDTDSYLRSDNIHPILRASSVRVVEMIKKIALISAVSNDPVKPVITVDDIYLGISIVENSHKYVETHLVDVIESSGNDTPDSKRIKKLSNMVRNCRSYKDKAFMQATKKGFLPNRMARKKLSCSKQDFNRAEEALVAAGEIEICELTQKDHGINVERAYFIP